MLVCVQKNESYNLYNISRYMQCWGTPGCRNVRLGGDTVSEDSEDEGPFLTYVVYKSFKHPPPIR